MIRNKPPPKRSWVQIPYRPEFFRPYSHYCSTTVYLCEDRFHIYISIIFPTFAGHFVVTPSRSKVESCSHISRFWCLLHRRLCHPHIATFYGAVFRKVPGGLEAAFVTEFPGVDLKKYVIDQPGNCPAKNPMTTMRVIRWAAQVVEALLSINNMFDGCVHGDLRLKNVLVRKYFICKRFVF